jgi:hypothetical protein
MKKSKRTVKKVQYVIPVGNGWAVKTDINGKFIIITDNKREAVSVAKDMAKRTESDLVIYGKDGKVADSTSYAKSKRASIKV